MVEEVLPVVPFRQLVFTIPRMLRKYFLYDRSLYGEFCRVAYSSTRDYMRKHGQPPSGISGFQKLKRAVPAMVVSPQSFGDLLVPHAHAHAVVSLGLFQTDGVFLNLEDLDFSGLEETFRERFFHMMLRRGKITPETVHMMKCWKHSGFQVDFQRRIEADDRKGLEGLLSYMERPPVSLRRLTYRDDSMVLYQGNKVHPRLGTDHQLVTPIEFLAMLVPHVLLRFEVTIRCYGAISTTFRRKIGWIKNPPVNAPPPTKNPTTNFLHLPPQPAPPPIPIGPSPSPIDSIVPVKPQQESEFSRNRRRTWARLIAKVYMERPDLCTSCKKPLEIVSAITSPAQDDVIERILRYLNLWDPPWKRNRKARGPPPSHHRQAPMHQVEPDTNECIDPPPSIEDYCVDPPAPEDF
jgi:hypothetical protein